MNPSFRRAIFNFVNYKNLKFIILLIIAFVLFSISDFSSDRKRFNKLPESVIENFNIELKSEQLLIPNDTVMNEDEMFAEAEKESNLPLIYWSQWKLNKHSSSLEGDFKVCDIELPSPHTLKFHNIYWQQMIVNNKLTLYLYNAYYDNREQIKKVKIISVTNFQKGTNKLNLWCLLWFENKRSPVLSKVSKIYSLWSTYYKWSRDDGIYAPQLITCDIPDQTKDLIPKAISLINNTYCDAKLDHNLRVIYNKPSVKQQFGVCVKAFRFATHDLSVRLIEWLEILKILGANKVHFYKYSAHYNIEKVLDFYAKQGFVDWKSLTLPNVQPNVRHLFQWYFDQIGQHLWPQELLEMNDCLYRNLYRYEYIAIFDIDEIIVPQNAYNWSQLMQEIKDSIGDEKKIRKMGYFENINTYVFGKLETDDNSIPSYLYTMRHIYRNQFTIFKPSIGKITIKCFHNLRNVEAVHNHYPLKCLGKNGYYNCPGHKTSTNHSYLMHFRKEPDYPEKCDKQDKRECAIKDTVMFKYYKDLNNNMKYALKSIFT